MQERLAHGQMRMLRWMLLRPAVAHLGLCSAWLLVMVACQPAVARPTPELTTPMPLSPTTPLPTPSAETGGILIGLEYLLSDNPARLRRLAQSFAATGVPAIKHLPDQVTWGAMQAHASAPLDFTILDNYVRETQAAGFRELVIALKSHNPWGSVDVRPLQATHAAPRPAYTSLYSAWVTAIVERYDGDGVEDMAGLQRPVRLYEVGVEFSSYEPEPAADYLEMLALAYQAAHAAYPEVQVAHAAFLTTTAFDTNPGPSEYEAAFAQAAPAIHEHSLAELRAILDRPDLFDLLNIHALGDPGEIEQIVRWLHYETGQRGYTKPIMISDTTPSPFMAWGPATRCDRPRAWMGQVIYPATEADRCRLATFFSQLTAGDEALRRWTQGFTAQDLVQKVVIAADQGIVLINTAFTEDLIWAQLPAFQAGAGVSAWAGLIDLASDEKRAGYYALTQVTAFLDGYAHITRLEVGNPRARVYAVTEGEATRWVAWLDAGVLVLPDDPTPVMRVSWPAGPATLIIEPVITRFGQTEPERVTVATEAGVVTLDLTPTPIFLYPAP